MSSRTSRSTHSRTGCCARPPRSDPPRGAVLSRRGRLSLSSRPCPGRRRVSPVPKNSLADLHERFAAWLELTAADRLREFEEIVGYHLEQAFEYRIANWIARRAYGVSCARSGRVARGGRPTGSCHAATWPAAVALLERVCKAPPPTIHNGSRCSPSSARR